jgi:hypothetical protein
MTHSGDGERRSAARARLCSRQRSSASLSHSTLRPYLAGRRMGIHGLLCFCLHCVSFFFFVFPLLRVDILLVVVVLPLFAHLL